MRGRPDLYTRYRDEMAMLKNPTQKFFASLLILGLLILGYIADDYWILLLTAAVFITAVASSCGSSAAKVFPCLFMQNTSSAAARPANPLVGIVGWNHVACQLGEMLALGD